LRLICHESKPDFLCLTESWLNFSHKDFEIRIDGYDLYRRDRCGPTKGGGVCIYVNKNHNFSIDVIENYLNIEMICVEVSQKQTKMFILITVYRLPNARADYTTKLTDFLESIHDKEVTIVCDLNVNFLEKSNSKYFENFKVLGFKQLINENTRINNESKSCIDLIFTNNYNNISGFGTLDINISDHKQIYISRKLNYYLKYNKSSGHKVIRYKDWKNINMNSLNNDISDLNLCFDFQQKDINFMCEQYFDNLTSLQNEHIIEKTIRLKQTPQQWFTIEIKTAIKTKQLKTL